jgi:hypothetical protein
MSIFPLPISTRTVKMSTLQISEIWSVFEIPKTAKNQIQQGEIRRKNTA